MKEFQKNNWGRNSFARLCHQAKGITVAYSNDRKLQVLALLFGWKEGRWLERYREC